MKRLKKRKMKWRRGGGGWRWRRSFRNSESQGGSSNK